MSKINYLLSEEFVYEKTIHADAGPGYARRHKWATLPFSRLQEAMAGGPTLIDNRISVGEMAKIDQVLASLARHPVYVKVVDPYWEHIRNPYYQWLLGLAKCPNVSFIGPYQTTGLTELLCKLSRPDAYVHLPYAYEAEKELPLDTGRRSQFLVFSGAVHPDFYPERSAMLRAMRRHWWASRRINVLPHPGYPDVGQVARHSLTGDRFLNFLATHRFMYLEPSRDRLEFLKYSECAYAGCVPVGRAPDTLPAGLRELILPLESSNLRRDLRRLSAMTPSACMDAARTYREQFRRHRDPDAMNLELVDHWQRQVARLGAAAA